MTLPGEISITVRLAIVPAAPLAAMRGVMVEKSAEAIVAGGNEPGAEFGPFKL